MDKLKGQGDRAELKLGVLFWNSLNKYTPAEKRTLVKHDSMEQEINKGISVGEYLSTIIKDKITYSFEPQVFTKAYIYAYNHPNIATYLVIEEINRGNCAQIFGDLFQLLDRKKDGTSEYSILAENDLIEYLVYNLNGSEGIKDGKLKLPSNLHIIATMNTSDQSLFPIDSAFKRRWEWKYVPIEQPKVGEMGDPRKWRIEVNGHWCYWWEFLVAINRKIEKTINSEDKQLGYFFTIPKGDRDFIDAETFVSKVVFYLWNDVFRDEDCDIFKFKRLKQKGWDVGKVKIDANLTIEDDADIYFRNFFINGGINEKLVHWFINNLLLDQQSPKLDEDNQNPIGGIAFMRNSTKSDELIGNENTDEDSEKDLTES